MALKLNASQKKVVESHSKSPITRRDFMGLGLLGMSTYFVSSLFDPFLNFAQAQPALTLPKFLTFDLVGGASIAGNWVMGGKGGSKDLLTSYSTLGYDPRKSTLDDRFGLPAAKNISQMFEGMISAMSEGAQKGFRLGSIAHQSVDDSDLNTHSTLGDIARYWDYKKAFSQSGLGLQGTGSGGRSKLNFDGTAYRPQQLTNISQLDLLSGMPVLKNLGLSSQEQDKYLKSTIGMTKDQLDQILKSATPAQRKVLLEAVNGLAGSSKFVDMDPRKSAEVRNVFKLAPNSESEDTETLIAGIINAHLNGWVGPSCIALEGFDYHDGTQTTGDTQDQRAGQIIGRAVELAHRLKTPLFIQVLSDGSVTSVPGTRNWAADSGDRSTTLLGYYNPLKTPNQKKTQVGHFTNGQIASLDSFVGNRTGNVAKVIFANYLSVCNDLTSANKFYTEGELSSEIIDDSLIFV